MRIKKLELIGFKSFKDRTVISFDQGITGIVGPNGCGKSNIVDALVWVMGEMSAKNLRGSAMSDVIFAGAEGYAPLGMAEVNLVLENDGGPFPVKYFNHSEIMITRRLHQSGESEYLINKEPARLRDIQEIFMDTGAGARGFSIIEQGAIGKIITAKPEERRTLIEEAAGITKFKARKRESHRKLERTEENLIRLQDILGEQKRQLNSLERQAQKAERYRRLRDEIEDRDLWVSSKKYLTIHADTEQARIVYNEAQEKDITASADLSASQAQLEDIKASLADRENAVQEALQKKQELHQSVIEKENYIREIKFEAEQARRDKKVTGGVIEDYAAREEALLKEQEELQQKYNEILSQVTVVREEFEEKNQEYQSVQESFSRVEDRLAEVQQEMLTVSQEESHNRARKDSLERQVQGAREGFKKQQALSERLSQKKKDFEDRRDHITGHLETETQRQAELIEDGEALQENFQDVELRWEAKKTETEKQKEALNRVSSRLEGLQELHANFEGFQDGVKDVIHWQKNKGEVSTAMEFKLLAEAFEVPKEYEVALEATLGKQLGILLSPSTQQALEAVEYLKQKKSGRSAFLSSEVSMPTGVPAKEALTGETGVLAWLCDVIQISGSWSDSLRAFVNSIVVVDSAQTALNLYTRYRELTFVTLEGDTVDSQGVFTGGAVENAQLGILKRHREIKELTEQKSQIQEQIVDLEKKQTELKGQYNQLKDDCATNSKRQSEKEIQIVELRKDLERAENEFQSAVQSDENQKREACEEQDRLQSLEAEKNQVQEQLEVNSQRRTSLEEEMHELSEEIQTVRDNESSLQEVVAQLRADRAAREQELEGQSSRVEAVVHSLVQTQESLRQMREKTEQSDVVLNEHQRVIEREQVSLEQMIHQAQSAEKDLAHVQDVYEQSSHGLRDLESKVHELIGAVGEYQSAMNDAQLKLEQINMKEQYLVDHVHEKYSKDLRTIANEFGHRQGDFEQTEAEIEELREQLNKIGEVYLGAIEEYNELKKGHEFLNQQHEDLIEAKNQLIKVIDRINRICSKRFKETFEKVNERFSKIFPVLFGGGNANLVLLEIPEKNEVGIDIIAKPPGKKAANVSLLSGGEKALTAVSLIFSIFLVKPSPFCLLDEVDAPLDDANVYRFNDLVREMAKRSQIIVVTHNKYTMSANDRLYGVTQEEKGVSKMVSVSLNEAVQVATASL